MKEAFTTAQIIFKYLFIAFTAIYWVGIVIDDWVLIEKYWDNKWLLYIGIWFVYYMLCSLMFSLFYWGIASILIFIYHKIVKVILK